MIRKFLFFLFAFLLLFLIFKGIIRSFAWIYIIIVNVVALGYMFYDKLLASLGKSKSRVSENKLLSIALLGGAPFMLLSMFIFRHKLLKPKFFIGVPIIFILNLIVYYFILRMF